LSTAAVPSCAFDANGELLRTETAAWHQRSNAKQRGVDWRFHVDDARVKLKSVYPKIIV
jgi:hypothetical protein